MHIDNAIEASDMLRVYSCVIMRADYRTALLYRSLYTCLSISL